MDYDSIRMGMLEGGGMESTAGWERREESTWASSGREGHLSGSVILNRRQLLLGGTVRLNDVILFPQLP